MLGGENGKVVCEDEVSDTDGVDEMTMWHMVTVIVKGERV